VANPVVSGQVSFPPQSSPVEQGLSFTPAWYRFLQGLFDRTGGGSGAPTLNAQSSPAGLVTSPLMLVPGANFISVSGAMSYVQLPSGLNDGQWTMVLCTTPSVQLNVLPPSGVIINSLAAGASYPINSGGAIAKPTMQIFWFENGQQCWTSDFS
jgi:hypothetical protein